MTRAEHYPFERIYLIKLFYQSDGFMHLWNSMKHKSHDDSFFTKIVCLDPQDDWIRSTFLRTNLFSDRIGSLILHRTNIFLKNSQWTEHMYFEISETEKDFHELNPSPFQYL